ncbi:SSS family solute:Na+ symporter [Anseongella ginsenosidimutans]|uniref:SSS family solute:Na+ symporter n=1 Tax=Anseongella ginsenosidimutans TaxID=496056 RepID=A0A4R3KLM1_9SPHI|nr:sodium/solute symporter [Anseongella ginsenosidimutans]TCS85033.1 SSS family solute:Na+ symporter [Anseongella ginsenosidimutans]
MNIVDHLGISDYSVIIVYLILLLAIGFWASRRSNQLGGDLFLGGRQLKWHTVGLSMWGTNVSPSMLIATASLAYSTGLVGGNFSWLTFPILLMLSKIFVPRYLHARIHTTPEYLSFRFNQTTRDIVAIYALVSILILWLGGTLYAGGIIVSQMLDWPLWLSVSLLMIVSMSFTITGGLTAVAYTDAFQMILLIIISLALLILGVSAAGGLEQVYSSAPEHYWHLLLPASDDTYPWYALILGYPVLGIWFWCTDQTIVQRALGAKGIQQAQKGVLFTAGLKILDTFLFVMPGIICFLLFPDLNNPDEAFLTLSMEVLPPGLFGLAVIAILASLISTIDSGLNSLSTVFILDVCKRKTNPHLHKISERKLGQWVTLLGAVLAVLMAVLLQRVEKDLFGLLQSIISYLAPPMSVVFLTGVLWKKATSKAANLTLVFGFALCFVVAILDLGGFPYKGFIPPYLLMSFYLFAFLSAFMVSVSLITGKEEDKRKFIPLGTVYRQLGIFPAGSIGIWMLIALVLVALYVFFN